MSVLSLGSSRTRAIPASAAARHDDIEAALRELREERRRLERLGFELPLARCEHETRYWRFVSALFTDSSRCPTGRGPGGLPCPDVREP